MKQSTFYTFLPLFLATTVTAQITSNSSDGYTGYSLTMDGTPDTAIYDTLDTPTNVSITNPDVYLNASVFVGEIDLTVSNLTAKVNVDAQVLSLLTFNAGVDVSIDRVSLLIQNVSAKVLLEARLDNVVAMINDTLNSLDLNPLLATLGQDVGTILNDTTGAVGSIVGSATGSNSTAGSKRSINLIDNILYSMNDYSGNTHTNQILSQNGSLVNEFLDNNGVVHGTEVVGSYLTDMTFNGYNVTTTRNGQVVHELGYLYTPFHGLIVFAGIFVDAAGNVVATQVLSESGAEGSSTIADL